MDLAVSTALIASAVLIGLAFSALTARRAVAFKRVEKDGGSVLLDKSVMNVAYWGLTPLGRAIVRAGISANGVTFASLVLALGAGVLVALGHFGLAAAAAMVAALGDALDGIVARESKTSSDSGEVFDAAVDRYSEFFFLGGLAVHYRAHVGALLLTLAALLASFMVSYSTAKAEALQVAAPRGAMRRAERATFLVVGAVLSPFTELLHADWTLREAPILAALVLVAIVGNVSAVRRLFAVADAIRSEGRGRRRTLPLLARHQLGSLAATVVDFTTMTLLVELGAANPVQATFAGATVGAMTNFLLGRRWIFRASHQAPGPQAIRYAIVSATSAGLNALGEHIAHDDLGVQYVVARAIVAVTVSHVWNLPMQRFFVFRHPTGGERDGGVIGVAERDAVSHHPEVER
jgi:CDP-diacylglycerol--glycerol-3-phosphate 3-phosphatidyltransferase